jgi:hypothetical protein
MTYQRKALLAPPGRFSIMMSRTPGFTSRRSLVGAPAPRARPIDRTDNVDAGAFDWGNAIRSIALTDTSRDGEFRARVLLAHKLLLRPRSGTVKLTAGIEGGCRKNPKQWLDHLSCGLSASELGRHSQSGGIQTLSLPPTGASSYLPDNHEEIRVWETRLVPLLLLVEAGVLSLVVDAAAPDELGQSGIDVDRLRLC